MAVNTPEQPLHVFEYSGTARSGKGTLVSALASRHEGVTVEETGADYRVVTFILLSANVLEPTMPPDRIIGQLGSQSVGSLTEIVAARPTIVAAHGLDCLYTDAVNDTVASVSQVPDVRTAVKEGFKKRVVKVTNDHRFDVLLVDGRILAPVIREVPNTELVLRTFVSCTAEEAARREMIRRGPGVYPGAYERYLQSFTERNRADAERDIDPVRPDSNAIDYWHFMINQMNPGLFAMLSGSQIVFDTTPFVTYEGCPRTAMSDAADDMYLTAMKVVRAKSGSPLSLTTSR